MENKKERYTYFKINIKDLNKLSSSDPKIKKEIRERKKLFANPPGPV